MNSQCVENTVCEMFATRGYSTFTPEEIPKNFMTAAHKPNGESVYVFGIIPDKLTIGLVKECIAYVSSIGCTHFIVVYGNSVTPPVKKLVDSTLVIRIELFSSEELGYNVTKHVLVPQHILASHDEYKQLKPYITKIPRILVSDPVVKFMGFMRGNVVKIVRHNGIVLFRLVV